MIRVIILFVALSAGGLCAWLLIAAKSAPQGVAASAPQVQISQVLVASADIPQGRVLGEKDLRWQPWPQDALSSAYISRSSRPDAMAALKGSVVRARFVAGEPIQEEKLARTQAGMLASMLPPGKRAVAIRVSAESAAGGFILPNDRVDVIRTISRQGGQADPENIGKTILSNIRVLAIDQKADDVKDSAFIGKTATLELNTEQAEILAAGQASGVLSLALRSAADNNSETPVRQLHDASIQVFHGERSELVRFQ